jgi:hypothetical protein
MDMEIIKPVGSSISVLMDGNMQDKDVTHQSCGFKDSKLKFFHIAIKSSHLNHYETVEHGNKC